MTITFLSIVILVQWAVIYNLINSKEELKLKLKSSLENSSTLYSMFCQNHSTAEKILQHYQEALKQIEKLQKELMFKSKD